MNYTVVKKLPPIEEIIRAYPLSSVNQQRIHQDRQEVKNILRGHDNRLLMIIGPCSAWPKEAVLDYAEKLSILNNKIKHKIKIIMRVYIQKPRTTRGWTGPVNQPDLTTHPDIEAGMRYTRDMMIKVIDMGLPIADEALFTHNAKGFIELLSWVAIGARSSENQEHRVFASAIDCAVGLKNPTHGSLAVAVNSIVAAQYPHTAVFENYEVKTQGNPFAHLVLRGSDKSPNYSLDHLDEAKRNINLHQLQHPAIIIDASHDNCILNGKKDHRLQPIIIDNILDSLQSRPDLKKLVKGFMVESFLKESNQKIDISQSEDIDFGGLSITDPCLGWEQTEEMLLHLANRSIV